MYNDEDYNRFAKKRVEYGIHDRGIYMTPFWEEITDTEELNYGISS